VAHPAQITLAILDPQRLIREALHALLKGAGVSVLGEATSPGQLRDVIDAQHPDVVLITLDGWGEHEPELLQELSKLTERARTLVLTAETDVTLHARVIELGAMGVVLKTESAHGLVKAVRKVQAGELWLNRSEAAAIINRLTRKRTDDDPEALRIASLTPRERQIVVLITEGLTNKDIAGRIFISEATARNHLTSILDKLQLRDRFQLAVYAFRRGLVPPPQPPSMLRPSEPPVPTRTRRVAPSRTRVAVPPRLASAKSRNK
jgi:DNA-binding NarL/FixJ family response regulator